jgi:hypothetical protein
LGDGQGQGEVHQTAQDVGVHRGGGGPLGQRRVVLDVPQDAGPRGVAQDPQCRERADGPVVRDGVEEDAQGRLGEGAEDEGPHQSLQPPCILHGVHHQEEKQNAEENLGKVANDVGCQRSMAQAEDEGRQRQQQEQQHRPTQPGRGEGAFAIRHPAERPDNEEHPQRRVQESGTETDVKGERSKGEQADDADDGPVSNFYVLQHPQGQHQGDQARGRQEGTKFGQEVAPAEGGCHRQQQDAQSFQCASDLSGLEHVSR